LFGLRRFTVIRRDCNWIKHLDHGLNVPHLLSQFIMALLFSRIWPPSSI